MNYIQTEHKKWAERNFPKTTPSQALIGIGEEYGELCHEHLKAEQGIREPTTEKARDAIGDMVIYIMHYCSFMNWDLDHIIDETWNTVKKRDWQKFPKNGRNE